MDVNGNDGVGRLNEGFNGWGSFGAKARFEGDRFGVDRVLLSRGTVDEAASRHLDNLSSLDWRSMTFYYHRYSWSAFGIHLSSLEVGDPVRPGFWIPSGALLLSHWHCSVRAPFTTVSSVGSPSRAVHGP